MIIFHKVAYKYLFPAIICSLNQYKFLANIAQKLHSEGDNFQQDNTM